MFKIMLKILEVFTIEYIPRLPIGLRKHFYKLILPLRKVKDKVALNGPKGDFTFEIRLEYAKLSRQGLNNSGTHLLKFDESVKVEKLENVLGKPNFVIVDEGMNLWQYEFGKCILDFFLKFNESTYSVVFIDIRATELGYSTNMTTCENELSNALNH